MQLTIQINHQKEKKNSELSLNLQSGLRQREVQNPSPSSLFYPACPPAWKENGKKKKEPRSPKLRAVSCHLLGDCEQIWHHPLVAARWPWADLPLPANGWAWTGLTPPSTHTQGQWVTLNRYDSPTHRANGWPWTGMISPRHWQSLTLILLLEGQWSHRLQVRSESL